MDPRTRRRVDALRRLADHPHTEAPLRESALAKIAELEAKHPPTAEASSGDPILDYLRRARERGVGVAPKNGKGAPFNVRPAERYAEDMRDSMERLNQLLRAIYRVPPGVDVSAPVRNGRVQEVDTDDEYDEPVYRKQDEEAFRRRANESVRRAQGYDEARREVGHIRYDVDPPRHVSWRYNADGSVHVIFRTGIY